jgi:hypothetical protein
MKRFELHNFHNATPNPILSRGREDTELSLKDLTERLLMSRILPLVDFGVTTMVDRLGSEFTLFMVNGEVKYILSERWTSDISDIEED